MWTKAASRLVDAHTAPPNKVFLAFLSKQVIFFAPFGRDNVALAGPCSSLTPCGCMGRNKEPLQPKKMLAPAGLFSWL